jgi:phosphoglycerate dehydrogenase-like enzyme
MAAGSTRPLVLQTENIDDSAGAWLAERCEIIRCSSDDPKFNDLLLRADGLLIRTYTNVNEAMLSGAPRLKVVARAGVGLDNVDVAACARRGVTVVSTPGANTRAVVELVTAFMLDALRPRVSVTQALDKGGWAKLRKESIAPRQLCDLTLGIVGFGRVGSAVARVGAAMNMRVIYNDLIEIAASGRSGASPAELTHVLREADVLTIHVDGRASNRHLVNAGALAQCKPNVLFLNTSRGFVVDPTALASFLRGHPAAQAALDVHEPEPFGPDYPLLGVRNCRLTAHIGAATATAHANMSWVVRDLWRVLSGEAPEHPATP